MSPPPEAGPDRDSDRDCVREGDRPERIPRLAMIARWKPLHAGQAVVLDELTRRAEHVTIGIGSSNRYNARNPFTAAETATMIRAYLGELGRDNYSILDVPDLDDGPRWRLMVLDMLGPLDVFVTANGYVRSLLMHDYEVVHPVRFVPPERRVRVDGSMVREAMARADGPSPASSASWRDLVPPVVAEMLVTTGLFERFRSELGADVIAQAGAVRASLTG